MMLAKSRAIERTSGHLYTYREGTESFGPFPGATAICGLQDSLGGSDGLLNWAVGLALDEVYQRLYDANGPIELGDWDGVRNSAFQAKNKARDNGSAIHAACDQINKGMFPSMTPEVAPYVAQYGAALFQKGIKILGSERYVVNTEIGVGGTVDSLVEIGDERGPLDVKSGKEKPSQRIQLTILEMGQWWGEAGMEAEPMPEMSGVGWILLLRPDSYELVRHEITDADRQHAIHLADTYKRIKEWSGEFAPTALREAA